MNLSSFEKQYLCRLHINNLFSNNCKIHINNRCPQSRWPSGCRTHSVRPPHTRSSRSPACWFWSQTAPPQARSSWSLSRCRIPPGWPSPHCGRPPTGMWASPLQWKSLLTAHSCCLLASPGLTHAWKGSPVMVHSSDTAAPVGWREAARRARRTGDNMSVWARPQQDWTPARRVPLYIIQLTGGRKVRKKIKVWIFPLSMESNKEKCGKI